jgi:hypothetical protein
MDEFVRRLATLGSHAADLTHAQVFDAMVAFYREERVSDVDVKGDMLLFEWGTYNWGNGRRFQIDVSRQLTMGPGDENQWQLRFTHCFDPSRELRALKQGNRWCETPASLPEFELYVRENPAHRAVRELKAPEIEFFYDVAD